MIPPWRASLYLILPPTNDETNRLWPWPINPGKYGKITHSVRKIKATNCCCKSHHRITNVKDDAPAFEWCTKKRQQNAACIFTEKMQRHAPLRVIIIQKSHADLGFEINFIVVVTCFSSLSAPLNVCKAWPTKKNCFGLMTFLNFFSKRSKRRRRLKPSSGVESLACVWTQAWVVSFTFGILNKVK